MQFTNPTTGPFVVSGGTIDSVTGAVGSVATPVVTNPASTVASVAGSVGSVTTPVVTDPASSIASVTASVPFPFRDGFFWPALSGEQFAPFLSTGWSATTQSGRPAYVFNGSGSSASSWANLPRVGFNGKTTISITANLLMSTTIGSAAADNFEWGFCTGGAAGTFNAPSARYATLRFNRLANNTFQVYARTGVSAVGGGHSSPVLATINSNDWHSYEIELTTTGIVNVYIDGVLVYSTAGNDWPSTATDMTPFPQASCLTSPTSSHMSIASMGVAWA